MILRDRDIANAWTSDADNKRTERRYYAQNWRADVSAILTDEGSMVEWVKYSAYGVPFGLPAGDTDSDGDWDGDDKGRIGSGAYDVRKDVNLDGVEDSDDVDQGNAVTGGNHALGRGVLSAGGPGGAVGNRRGYAGYEYAPELEGTGAAGRHLYHVRHRVYDADVGRWTRRDPLGYVDGMGIYVYVSNNPINMTDTSGLRAEGCTTCTRKAHLLETEVYDDAHNYNMTINAGLPPVPPWGPPPDRGFMRVPCPPILPNGVPIRKHCNKICGRYGWDGANHFCYAKVDSNGIIQWAILRVRCACAPRGDGECAPHRRRQLQDKIDELCHGAPGCSLGPNGTPCDQVDSRISRLSQCAYWRWTLNNECYSGGNYGHRDAYEQVLSAILNCGIRKIECIARGSGQ